MAGSYWKIHGEERNKFENIFDSLGPTGGKLGGDKVKPVLLNSKLPTDVLGQVWELSDIDKDGCLDRDEFCVAMHLVYKALEHEPVPTVLPQDLLPPLKRKPALVGGVAVLPPISAAASFSSPSLNIGLPAVSSPSAILNPVSISAPQQAKSNLYIKGVVPDIEFARFAGIFSQKVTPDGYIAGSEARDIFVQSGLPQQVLAHVWNLCDQQLIGKLNQDQFILAMHFIAQKVKGINVPTQLPPEILVIKARDSGFGDSGNLSDSSSSGVGDFSAVRELDGLNREIEELRREKEILTSEVREKEQIIRVRSSEVQELQNTLDRSSTSLSQLESDKAEVHTRIDDLDHQQLKLDGMIADVRAKVQEETMTIANLQAQIKEQELTNRRKEGEHNRMKSELESLKKEETQLQQTLDIGEQQLQHITKQLNDTNLEMKKVEEQISSLAEERKTVASNIEQYGKAVTALRNETESTNESSLAEFGSPGVLQSKDDPFKSSDPFASGSEFKTDPFADTSAFGTPHSKTDLSSSNISDAFGSSAASDAFGSTSANDAFGATSISDVFGSTAAKDQNDPFSSKNDPFASQGNAFESSSFDKDPFGGSDPFSSAVASSSPKKAAKSPPHTTEMFSVNFSDSNPSVVSLFNDSEKVTTKSDPSDDPWAAFGGGSSTDLNDSGSTDPFGKDSFVPNPSAAFNDFGSSSFTAENNSNNKHSTKDVKAMSEEAQLAWAAEQSKKEEEERRERVRIQEQLDLEYAIKLSKEM